MVHLSWEMRRQMQRRPNMSRAGCVPTDVIAIDACSDKCFAATLITFVPTGSVSGHRRRRQAPDAWQQAWGQQAVGHGWRCAAYPFCFSCLRDV
jgi:hypothetical protein